MGLFSFFRPKRRVKKASTPSPRQKNAFRLHLEALEDRFMPSCNTISGHVYQDTNNNGLFDPGETPVANSPIQLKNGANVVVGSTTTDANGYYEFTYDETVSTAPTTLTQIIEFPSTQTNYVLSDVIDQFDPSLGELLSVKILHEGSVTSEIKVENTSSTSTSRITATVAGNLTLTGPNVSNGLSLNENAGVYNAGTYDGALDFIGSSGHSFGQVATNGSSQITLTGNDINAYIGTGQVVLTETANATSVANGGGNLVASVVSTAAATVTVVYTYIPSNCLEPGNYTIVQVTQPPGLFDGQESRNGVVLSNPPGVDVIPVTLGEVDLPNNNFGELPPAGLSGFVYVDSDNDGVKDPGETPIAGVLVTLTGADNQGPVTRTAFTDENGQYRFSNLRHGTYTITETQPSTHLDGRDTIGTPGGVTAADQFNTIVLAAGVLGANNNFGELNPSAISGFVFADTDDDGVKDPGEAGISGVLVTLTGGDDRGPVTRTARTNTSGYYEFTSLRPGTYSLQEDQPANYLDGKDSIGTQGGILGAGSLGGGAGPDVFTNLVLLQGTFGINNNFGEIPIAEADLAIQKTASAPQVKISEQLVYTLQVTNLGTHTAEDVVVVDTLPVGAVFVSASGAGWNCVYANGVLTCTTSEIGVQAVKTITITIKAMAVAGNMLNVTDVTSSTPDPNLDNNHDEVITPVIYDGQTLPKTLAPLETTVTAPTVSGKLRYTGTWLSGGAQSLRAKHAYVDGLFRSLFGRPSTGAEQTYYANLLSSGTSKQQIVQTLWNADEHLALVAEGYYESFFHRLPTAAEKAALILQLRNGANEMQLAHQFLTSSEYQAAHATPELFVRGFYQDVLGEIPGSVTQQLWVNALGVGTVQTVATNMLNSTDALSVFVEIGFGNALRRWPTSAELQFWTNKVQSGQISIGEMMRLLLASDEFYNLTYAVITN